MKLISLELKNFRQHIDSTMNFTDGLTGVIGPNGAGKTTILEAIAWALYGASALRGNNDTLRSTAAEGGAKASASLTFELSGQVYKATRTMDGAGRSGSAVLEVDGRALRSGMSDVTEGVTRLLGMDYHAFFTSFFTGQKQLQFMAQLEGRARAVAISRMLGYERVSKARDQVNEDRKGLQREIDGLERGLPDPEDLKQRKKDAQEALASASAALKVEEETCKKAAEALEVMKPLKDASDQKARRSEEITRRLESDQTDIERACKRFADVQGELAELEKKRAEFEVIREKLSGFKDEAEELKRLTELAKHEDQRQRLEGQVASLERDIRDLRARESKLGNVREMQVRESAALAESEAALVEMDQKLQKLREDRIARSHSLEAQINNLKLQKQAVEAKRAQIAEAGEDGACPTCERPLAQELNRVLGNFDSQINDFAAQMRELQSELDELKSSDSELEEVTTNRQKVSEQINQMRTRKATLDGQVVELDGIQRDLASRTQQLGALQGELAQLPAGFDRARFEQLQKLKESLSPVREQAAALKAELDRGPRVQAEAEELSAYIQSKEAAVKEAEASLRELAFSAEEHEKLTKRFEEASVALHSAEIQVERQRGEVGRTSAVLEQIEKEEESYAARLADLKEKRTRRLVLQTLAEALDKLRAELNDRIRPELESRASELLSMMTDGRYNVLEISESYQAMIRDDGELKPVISGGEEDIVNLALRLAVSQMIADRAGQSFSLLILDEVFGSLDDVRRDNVVALLQNLKNRFEQIILITHVDSVHDAVDNCLWVEFDERSKTSRLTDRSNLLDQPEAGILV